MTNIREFAPKWAVVYLTAKPGYKNSFQGRDGKLAWTRDRARAERWAEFYPPDPKEQLVVDAEAFLQDPRKFVPSWRRRKPLDLYPKSEEDLEHEEALAALPHPVEMLQACQWLRAGAPTLHRDMDPPACLRTPLQVLESLPHFIPLYCYGTPENRAAYEARKAAHNTTKRKRKAK